MPRVDDIRLNEFLRTRVRLLEPIVSELVKELLELRAFKDSMEPLLEWVDGQGGSYILKLNDIGVGHVIPVVGDWSWNAALEPKIGFPYQLEGCTRNERPSLEIAQFECEEYVRKHLARTQVTCATKTCS
jgi:hypothetical protein